MRDDEEFNKHWHQEPEGPEDWYVYAIIGFIVTGVLYLAGRIILHWLVS